MVGPTPITCAVAPKPTGNKPPASAPPTTPNQVSELLKSQSAGFQRLLATAPPRYAPINAPIPIIINVIASSPSGSTSEIGELPAYLYGLKYCDFGSG